MGECGENAGQAREWQPVLYHGSCEPIAHPDIMHNTGFADLGIGFYLTDDYEAARRRALSRARREGVAQGVVSRFVFDDRDVVWLEWGADDPAVRQEAVAAPFGLRFESGGPGLVAWVDYIKRCRRGITSVGNLGDPAVVRAWIATEEVEMVCAGLLAAQDLPEALEPLDLVVQYCLLDQDLIDRSLHFVAAERIAVDMSHPSR